MNQNPKSLKILLAEDSEINQKLVSKILKNAGHQLIYAVTGVEAVEKRQSNSVDLILMDVQMPEMNGFDATLRIRKLEMDSGGHTPIVAMTAHALTGDRERCLDAGMDDYISKPISIDALHDLVSGYTIVNFSGENIISGSSDKVNSDEAIINWDEALNRMGGDYDFFYELITEFFEEAAERAGKMLEAVKMSDMETLQDEAHFLKGSSGVFSLKKVFNLTVILEKYGRDQVVDGCVKLVTELIEEIQSAKDHITANIKNRK